MLSLLLAFFLSPPALGNGAFPDSLQILLPADRPDQIGLATNFGLILSEDGGATWAWVCEGDLGDPLYLAYLYQVGPSPTNRVVALNPESVVSSLDNGCTWQKATGSIEDTLPTDVFSDPNDAERVFALALPSGGVEQAPFMVESRDGARTFNNTLFRGPIAGGLTGVEISRSSPRTLYVAWFTTTTVNNMTLYQPKLSHSLDEGQTWTAFDLEPALGSTTVKVIAIDHENPQRVFVRVMGAVEKLGVTDDGGKTMRTPVEIPGVMGGFVRLPSGVILVGGTIPPPEGAVAEGAVYRSSDGGMTFTRWENAPRVRGLAQRDGKIYVAGDNFVDGFALAEISEDGKAVKPLMKFADVASIKACVRSRCAEECRRRALLGLWSESACGTPSGSGGSGGAGGTGGTTPRPKKTGCGCHAAGGAGAAPPLENVLWLLGLLVVSRRPKR